MSSPKTRKKREKAVVPPQQVALQDKTALVQAEAIPSVTPVQTEIVFLAQDKPPTPHQPDALVRLAEAHKQFVRAFTNMLLYAKEGGEALLLIQADTGKKGAALFEHVRDQAKREQFELTASDRTLYLYLRVATCWNKLQVMAGDALNDLSLSQAVKLLQQGREEKPITQNPDATPTQLAGNPATKVNAITSETENRPSSASGVLPPEADPKKGKVVHQKQEAEADTPLAVPQPFDLPTKDHLAAIFTENGPAPTPIQLMTSIVIPSLKKVADVRIEKGDLPFLSNAIQEAFGLIEALKAKLAAV